MRQQLETSIIIDAIEKNYSDFRISMAKLKECDYAIGENFNYAFGKWPSGIYDIKMTESNIQLVIDDMVTKMKNGLLPKVVITGPSSQPPNYDAYFIKHGLKKIKDIPGMAINLDEFKHTLPENDKIGIELVNDSSLTIEWVTIVCEELLNKTNPEFIKEFYDLLKTAITNSAYKLFVAKYEGKAVATSLLYLNNGTAGLYFVATKKAYRGKGIGKRITIAPTIYAKKHGYRFVVLQASDLGAIVYNKLGYKEYCTLRRYRLTTKLNP